MLFFFLGGFLLILLFQKKNRFILNDAIGLFSIFSLKVSESDEAKKQFVSVIVPILLEHLNEYSNDDKAVCNFTECFCDIYDGCGIFLQPFTEIIFKKHLLILDTNLESNQYDSEYITPSLSLFTKICEVFKTSIESLVHSSNLLALIFRAIKLQHNIRQEALCLLGDLSPFCISLIIPTLNVFIPELVSLLVPGPSKSADNACWVLGMIIRNCSSQDILPYSQLIFNAFKSVLAQKKLELEILQNCAFSIGHLSFKVPQVVAADLRIIFQRWCFAMKSVKETNAKTFAFLGICQAIEHNPSSIFNQNLVYLFESIASWDQPCEELCTKFHFLLNRYKQSAPPSEWQTFLNSVDSNVLEKLDALYNIK